MLVTEPLKQKKELGKKKFENKNIVGKEVLEEEEKESEGE